MISYCKSDCKTECDGLNNEYPKGTGLHILIMEWYWSQQPSHWFMWWPWSCVTVYTLTINLVNRGIMSTLSFVTYVKLADVVITLNVQTSKV